MSRRFVELAARSRHAVGARAGRPRRRDREDAIVEAARELGATAAVALQVPGAARGRGDPVDQRAPRDRRRAAVPWVVLSQGVAAGRLSARRRGVREAARPVCSPAVRSGRRRSPPTTRPSFCASTRCPASRAERDRRREREALAREGRNMNDADLYRDHGYLHARACSRRGRSKSCAARSTASSTA